MQTAWNDDQDLFGWPNGGSELIYGSQAHNEAWGESDLGMYFIEKINA
jgi:hypothetical protein